MSSKELISLFENAKPIARQCDTLREEYSRTYTSHVVSLGIILGLGLWGVISSGFELTAIISLLIILALCFIPIVNIPYRGFKYIVNMMFWRDKRKSLRKQIPQVRQKFIEENSISDAYCSEAILNELIDTVTRYRIDSFKDCILTYENNRDKREMKAEIGSLRREVELTRSYLND